VDRTAGDDHGRDLPAEAVVNQPPVINYFWVVSVILLVIIFVQLSILFGAFVLGWNIPQWFVLCALIQPFGWILLNFLGWLVVKPRQITDPHTPKESES
jgi:hypothetical protein